MKKRNFAVRLGIVAMALTLVTTSLSSGTLAKYTDTFKAYGTLTVANWNVGARAAGQLMLTSGDGLNLEDLAKTATGTVSGVASGTIAPGMKGEFKIDLSMAGNTAEANGQLTGVDVYYEVYASVTSTQNLPPNLTFKAQAGSASASPITFANANQDVLLTSGTIDNTSTSSAAKSGWNNPITVSWEWPWLGTQSQGTKGPDALDTETGSAAANDGSGTTKFNFKVVMTQVDPTGNSSHLS